VRNLRSYNATPPVSFTGGFDFLTWKEKTMLTNRSMPDATAIPQPPTPMAQSIAHAGPATWGGTCIAAGADMLTCNIRDRWNRTVQRAAWWRALVACASALCGPALGDATSAAEAAAQTWLKAADAGDGARTWNLAAPLFQQSIAVERWTQALTSARSPLGAVQQRALSSSTHAMTLPGAPDGDYVVMQFHTVFEHNASAVETVTTARQSDGSWRVTGYFVK
jgi:hypothetical protein